MQAISAKLPSFIVLLVCVLLDTIQLLLSCSAYMQSCSQTLLQKGGSGEYSTESVDGMLCQSL